MSTAHDNGPRDLYKSLSGSGELPLEAGDPRYVPILGETPDKDPILQLRLRIALAESQSVDLLTGFRGNGKSTELRRLKKLLEDDGCRVILVDMADYLLTTKPVEITDFILSLMSALSEAVKEDTGLDAQRRGYGDRLRRFLTSEVQIESLDLELGPDGATASLGMALKSDPDFKERIQKHLRGHVTRLIQDARGYVIEVVKAIRRQAGEADKKVVLLVDSVEQIRGVGQEAGQVHESVAELFSGQAANLRFDFLHVVYTIPPYLSVLTHNLGRSLGGHPITSWPNIHVRDDQGVADPAGLAVMKAVIGKRYPGWEPLIPRRYLHRLAASSGGDLRDFFRLVRECMILLMTRRMGDPQAGLDEEGLRQVEQQLLNEMLPLAEADARWLARIHQTKQAALPDTSELPDLARYLDGNLIMNYLNGRPWFDIHPLLLDQIAPYLKKPSSDEAL